jgi:Na+(H+)/acetate symporter ActP
VETLGEFLITTIVSLLHISPMVAGVVISVPLLVAVGVTAYLLTGNKYIAMVSQTGGVIACVFVGVLPHWVALCYGFFVVAFTVSQVFYNPEGEVDAIETQAMDEWEAYGQRLKLAYSAKFGGDNPGFDDEVNQRVRVMQRIRGGFTHTIARDWLRRMEKFTESK